MSVCKSIVHHEEWLEALASFCKASDAAVIKEAPRLLEYASFHLNDHESMPLVSKAIQEAYWQALLRKKDFETVLSEDKGSIYGLYALYRLERYDELEKALQKKEMNSDDPALQHLRAQTLFHTNKADKAVEAYAGMQQDQVEVWTNRVAVQAAHCLPYVSTAAVAKDLVEEQALESFLNQDSDEYPYDLALNLATLQLFTGTARGTATQRLIQAQAAVRAQVDDPAEQASEMAPIATNLAWSRAYWSGTVPATTSLPHASAQVQWVQETNAALASKTQALPPIPSDVKVSLLQRRLAAYNKAVLQLAQSKHKECQTACLQMMASLTKRKSDFGGLPALDQLWWKTRLTVLQAHAAVRSDQSAAAAKLVETLQAELQGLPVSVVRDACLGYTVLHASVLTKTSLEWDKLPDSWQDMPAVRATRAALLFAADKHDEAAALLASSSSSSLVLADFWLSQGKFQEAARLYQEQVMGDDEGDFVLEDNVDLAVVAKWVQALSHVDPTKAKAIWKQVQPELTQEDDDDDEEALEAREIPRLKTRKTVAAAAAAAQEPDSTKQVSREAILARRARQRQAYLAELERKGLYRSDRPTAPNPERWIPKYERSHSRRRRGPHRGAQGGVSEADASKLDVAARQALKAQGLLDPNGSRSTAHMVVAGDGGPRKQKGRRK